MVGDGEYGVKAPQFRELGDEVKGDCFEGKGVLWFDWVEGGFCYGSRLVLYLVPLCSPLRCFTCYLFEMPVSVACDREYQLHKMDCLSRYSGSSYPT